jgi:vacuolar-type H+-ATPase subunit H
VNEKRIREVIDVEQRALDLLAQAQREAEQIPINAEAQAAAIISKARKEAQDEASQMIEAAQKGDEAAAIISRGKEAIDRAASLAVKNQLKAVAYVLDSVLGRS